MLNKSTVIDSIIKELRKEFELAKGASIEAADYATHEEAKADSKWDTQGLEASYLAAGQAAQAGELYQSLQSFLQLREEVETIYDEAAAGSLVEVLIAGESNWFLISGAGGGVTVTVDGISIMVITPHSPVATAIIGKGVGFPFRLPNGLDGSLVSVS